MNRRHQNLPTTILCLLLLAAYPTLAQNAPVNHNPSTVSRNPSSVNHNPSPVSRNPSSVNHNPSTVSRQPSTVGRKPSPVGRQTVKFSRHLHYTMDQGLSNNSVTSIAQDDDGFLWFGTEEGLNRFDGERFTCFFQQADGRGLPLDHVNQLIALPGNKLLIGSEKGLTLLQTRGMTFSPVLLPDETGVLQAAAVIWNLYRARNGQIWVATNSAVIVLDVALKVLQVYQNPEKSANATATGFARGFFELPDGTILVKYAPSNRPVYSPWQVIDFQQQKTIPLSILRPELGPLDSAALPFNMTLDAQNNIWFSAMGTQSPTSVYCFNWDTKTCRLVLRTENAPAEIKKQNQFFRPFMLPDSLLLMQRFFGPPLVYQPSDGSSFDLPDLKTSWPDGKTIVQFLDRDGNLWLGPRFEGVYLLALKDLPATPMTALNETHKKRMALSGVSEEWFAFTCAEVGDKWVAGSGNGGLYSFDKTGMGVRGNVADNLFNSYAYVNSFTADRGDTLWTNTLGGIYWYNPASNTTGPLQTIVSGLDSMDNRYLYRDRYGLIWGRVRNNGVCCFDTRTRKFTPFPSKGEHAPFPINSATACTEGPDGDIWFSFGSEEKYVVRWRRQSGQFETVEPRSPEGTSCAKAFRLIADRQGNLWLYAGQRWYIMDIKSREVTPFGKVNGLSTNSPAGACIDRDGNLWFATSFGLSRFNPANRQLRTFYQTDGLLSNSISNVELIDTVRNILFVSTDKGLCLFEPDKVRTSVKAPPTILTSLRVSDQEMPLPDSGVLDLTYDQNDLRMEFTGINFINGVNNRYQYSMEPEGSAAEWKDAGTDNFANFLNLPPGRYMFLCRTADSDGAWGTAVASLSIQIYPPWWRTWAFQLSLLAALLAFGWWFYQRQISRAETREAEKAKVRQQLGDLEMRALRSQMNPHFVFNALNSVQNFILKNDTREASRYLTKFARLMRLILENSESPVVPLDREIELLRYYTEMEGLRFNHRFSFDFYVDPTLNLESVAVPGMLIQPHIENAIWHGLMHKESEGKLWVRFMKGPDNTIVCEIEDNGVGRARAAVIEKDRPKNHRSTGLANIQNRLELLNAQLAKDIRLDITDLYDEQGHARGTKVEVRMPMMSNQSFTASKNDLL